MKIKLKVSKKLKSELKGKAESNSVERKVYIQNLLEKHIGDNKSIWENKIEGYAEFLLEREEKLSALKIELDENEEMSAKEKGSILKEFYKENKFFRTEINKNKKLENIIINLDDELYYALNILADNKELSIENYTVELLIYN